MGRSGLPSSVSPVLRRGRWPGALDQRCSWGQVVTSSDADKRRLASSLRPEFFELRAVVQERLAAQADFVGFHQADDPAHAAADETLQLAPCFFGIEVAQITSREKATRNGPISAIEWQDWRTVLPERDEQQAIKWLERWL